MIKIELTQEEWSRLLNCAALAPFVQVASLIEKIAKQIQDGQKEVDEASYVAGNGSMPRSESGQRVI
jgi:hypothetical protein